MDDSDLDDAGAQLLAEALKEALVPITLYLDKNKLGVAGAGLMADAIENVRFPFILDLSFNRNDLPGDAIVIAMTDGIFDGLGKLGLLKDSKSEDGKFSFQELDVDKMNARYHGQGIDSAQGIKEAIMLDTQIDPVMPEELQMEIQTKQAQVNSMLEELEKFKGSQDERDKLGKEARKLALDIHNASRPKGDDLTIVAIEVSNLIRERARGKEESGPQR